MDDDKLEFLDEKPEAEEPQEIAETEAEEVEATAETEPETGEKEEVVPPTPPEGSNSTAPLTALLDEREKRQEAQRRAEALERQLAQYTQQQTEKPDFFDNPDQILEERIYQNKLQQSRFLAEKEYGQDLVNEAYEYFAQRPHETQTFRNHPSPYHAAVETYKRQKFLSEVQDPEKWKAEQLELAKQQALAELAAQSQTSKPQAPPPSMATATAAGKDAISKGNAFDEVFS